MCRVEQFFEVNATNAAATTEIRQHVSPKPIPGKPNFLCSPCIAGAVIAMLKLRINFRLDLRIGLQLAN